MVVYFTVIIFKNKYSPCFDYISYFWNLHNCLMRSVVICHLMMPVEKVELQVAGVMCPNTSSWPLAGQGLTPPT